MLEALLGVSVCANVHPVTQLLQTVRLGFGNNETFDICLQHQLLLELPEEQTWFTKALFLVGGFFQCLFFVRDVCS